MNCGQSVVGLWLLRIALLCVFFVDFYSPFSSSHM